MKISIQEFQELWQQDVHSLTDEYETIQLIPPALGKGYRRSIELRNGISLLIHDYQLHEDLVIKQEAHQITHWELGFQLSGKVWLGEHYHRISGQNFMGLPGVSSSIEIIRPGNQLLNQLDIHVDVPDILWNFFQEHSTALPLSIQGAIEALLLKTDSKPDLAELWRRENKNSSLSIGKTSIAMKTIISLVLDCPYSGIIKQAYLESKALELIALRLFQLKQQLTHKNSKPKTLKLEDIDRIHAAKEIMIKNIDNPPSLLNLARQVNINDCKLKIGFRQEFGTTVFGYLLNHRMEQAHTYLQEGKKSIGEIARIVGYKSRTSFIAAFKKRYGICPSDLQKNLSPITDRAPYQG